MKDFIPPKVSHEVSITISGWILTLLGVATLAGGAWLAALGGTPFYVAMGFGLLATGVLVIRRHTSARAGPCRCSGGSGSSG